MNGKGKQLIIQEVGPRDGLQNEAVFVPTSEKVAFVDQLSACGFKKIEVTSFTSPRAIPALKDAAEVMQQIRRYPGVTYCALVPNVKGTERALEAQTDEVNFVMSASHSHNLENLGMTREDSLKQLADIIRALEGTDCQLSVSLSTVFGCAMEGPVASAEVERLVEQLVQLGVQQISLCDTAGMAHPAQVAALGRLFLQTWPEIAFTMHFHDTRGMGLANVLAALQVGVRRFDASVGGLGGCPYSPGASGNICTEDLVHMLNLMGYDTGIDLEPLLQVARSLPELIDRQPPGYLIKAGPV